MKKLILLISVLKSFPQYLNKISNFGKLIFPLFLFLFNVGCKGTISLFDNPNNLNTKVRIDGIRWSESEGDIVIGVTTKFNDPGSFDRQLKLRIYNLNTHQTLLPKQNENHFIITMPGDATREFHINKFYFNEKAFSVNSIGNYRAFFYEPGMSSDPVFLSIPAACDRPNRTYNFEYDYFISPYNALEYDPNHTILKSAYSECAINVNPNIYQNQSSLQTNYPSVFPPDEPYFTIELGQDPATYLRDKFSPYFQNTLNQGYVVSLGDLKNYSDRHNVGGVTLLSYYTRLSYCFIPVKRIKDLEFSSLNLPKVVRACFIHELGHQMIFSSHNYKLIEGSAVDYEAPEDDYDHVNKCVMEWNWPAGLYPDYDSYKFCDIHQCSINKSFWN